MSHAAPALRLLLIQKRPSDDGLGLAPALACCAGCLALLGSIAALVQGGEIAVLDLQLRLLFHHYFSLAGLLFTVMVSLLGSPALLNLMSAILVVALWHARQTWAALLVGWNMMGAMLLSAALGHLFHALRPVGLFAGVPLAYSFPSPPALLSCCFFLGLVAIFAPRLRPAWRAPVWAGATLLVLSVGISRVGLGLHPAGNVLAGYTAGLAWLSAGWAAVCALARSTASEPSIMIASENQEESGE